MKTTESSVQTTENVTGTVAETTEVTTAQTTEAEHKEPDILKLSTFTRINFYRDNLKIYGKLFLPEGDGPFPVVIFSAGWPGTLCNIQPYAKKFTDKGVASLVFDFTGSGGQGQSDGLSCNMSVFTQAADLNVVYDGISSVPEIDSDNIFLWGHSLGGLTSTYVAEQRPEDIKGLILVEPSYSLHDEYTKQYPDKSQIPDIQYGSFACGRAFYEDLISLDIYEKMSDYDGNVILFSGTTTQSIGGTTPEYYERAAQTFPSIQVEAIDGANHGFTDDTKKPFLGDTATQMFEKTIDYINKNIDR